MAALTCHQLAEFHLGGSPRTLQCGLWRPDSELLFHGVHPAVFKPKLP